MPKRNFKLLDNAGKKLLFLDCDYVPSFVVKLIHIKCMIFLNNDSFDMLLTLLKDAFSMYKTMPNANYKANKIVSDHVYNMRK